MANTNVKSEIAGKVWKIEMQPGDQVGEEDAIMILESMKMEIPVFAPSAGKLISIQVAEEDLVKEGQVVAVIES